MAQSHRAVSNHRRLKSIMKKQVAEDVADGEDREAQHALFLETMQGEAQYTIQIVSGAAGGVLDAVRVALWGWARTRWRWSSCDLSWRSRSGGTQARGEHPK